MKVHHRDLVVVGQRRWQWLFCDAGAAWLAHSHVIPASVKVGFEFFGNFYRDLLGLQLVGVRPHLRLLRDLQQERPLDLRVLRQLRVEACLDGLVRDPFFDHVLAVYVCGGLAADPRACGARCALADESLLSL